MPKEHHSFILALLISRKIKVPPKCKKNKNKIINHPLYGILCNLKIILMKTMNHPRYNVIFEELR